MANTKSEQDALHFLRSQRLGVISGVKENGTPHSALIYYVASPTFSIYFFTKTNTKKYETFQKNPIAAFVVGSSDFPQVIQMEGTIRVVPREEQDPSMISELLTTVSSNPMYPAPLVRMDDAEVVLMELKPTWLRWADFAFGRPNNNEIFFEIIK